MVFKAESEADVCALCSGAPHALEEGVLVAFRKECKGLSLTQGREVSCALRQTSALCL